MVGKTPLSGDFGTKLRHNALTSLYNVVSSNVQYMNNYDHLHVAVVSVGNPLLLYLPKVSTYNSVASLAFLYVTGPSGGQIQLQPFPDDAASANVNGGPVGGSVSYTQGATNMVLLVFRKNFQFFICPVSFQLGGGGGGGSTSVQAGTGITVTQLGSVYTVVNAAPDQTVALNAGSGVSVAGTYPNFTIANSAPDQVVSLLNGTGIAVTGAYPTFTVTNSMPDQTVVLNSGAGMSITGTYPTFNVANTAPDQVVSISSGAGIGVSGSYPSFSVTNTAPDQVVSLTSASSYITISGTYPNFTLSTPLLMPSYIQASQTIASYAIGNTSTQITTAFTKNYASSEWTVDGSGGFVYSSASSGRAIWFSVDYKQTSSTTGNQGWITIQRNSNNNPVMDIQVSVTGWFNAAGAVFTASSPIPITVEPGDIFHVAFRSNTAGSATNAIIAVNIASTQ